MKNVIVANFPEKQSSRSKQLELMVEAQIYNSKSFGWESKDIVLVTNRDLDYDVAVFNADLNKFCLTGSKVFALKWLFDNTIMAGPFWLHDLDAWQSCKFECPEFKDAGFCNYSRPKINGGSQFWKRSGEDILNKIVSTIINSKSKKEEPVIQDVCRNMDRVTILNNRYNVGCSGFSERVKRSEKPIAVCHLHPYNRIAWQTHRLDRDGLGLVSVSPQLEENLRKFFKLPTSLDEEGSRRRAQKIEIREKRKNVKK